MRYITNPIEFLQSEMLMDDGRPIQFYDWQRDVLTKIFAEDGPDYSAITTIRQQGKSTILAGIGIANLFLIPNQLIVSIACDSDQANIVLSRASDMIRRNPHLSMDADVTQGQIYCKANGSRWMLMSSDKASVTGQSIDWLLFDEIGQLPEFLYDLFFLALPSLSARHGKLIAASTRGAITGDPLHYLIELASTDSKVFAFDSHDIINPTFSQAQMERDKKLMPASVWRRMYQNVISDSENGFLPLETIRRMVYAEAQPYYAGQRYCGVDLGIRKDRTAIATILNPDNSNKAIIDDVKVFDSGGEDFQIEEAERYIRQLWLQNMGQMKVCYDPWQSIGLAQRLKSSGIQVSEYTFSASSRKRLFQNLFSTISEGNLVIYADEELQTKCLDYGCKVCMDGYCANTGYNTFLQELKALTCDSNWNVQHPSSGHDDAVVAVGLALSGALAGAGVYAPLRQGQADFSGTAGSYGTTRQRRSYERDGTEFDQLEGGFLVRYRVSGDEVYPISKQKTDIPFGSLIRSR